MEDTELKDPAFLFYSESFIAGVQDLTMEERGQYITLLCLQHSKGILTEKTISLAVGNVSDDVLSKFERDENGHYYNKRLLRETAKRANYTKSRRENLKGKGKSDPHMGTHMDNHMDAHMEEHMEEPMGDHMINININIDKDEITSENTCLFMENVREIIGHLNSSAGTGYRPTGKATQRQIRARMNDGFTVDNFMTVIDKKSDEWKGTEFEKFLRPETLFGTKFEGYLNQPSKAKKSGNPFLDRAMARGAM
jgi:uncharacterized phage protein (TIGR02220 family)